MPSFDKGVTLLMIFLIRRGIQKVKWRFIGGFAVRRLPLFAVWTTRITIAVSGWDWFGAIAQLGERSVRNAKVGGSTPLRSIRLKSETVEL